MIIASKFDIVPVLALAFMSLALIVIGHEQAHAAIFKMYGCTQVEIVYEVLDFDKVLAYTSATCVDPSSGIYPAQDLVHAVQKLVWAFWALLVIIFEVLYLSR